MPDNGRTIGKPIPIVISDRGGTVKSASDIPSIAGAPVVLINGGSNETVPARPNVARTRSVKKRACTRPRDTAKNYVIAELAVGAR